MHVINNSQMREFELKCGVDGYILMERAGAAISEFILTKYQKCKVIVMCGFGNNGGDGFVTARLLRENGWDVDIATISNFSPEKYEVTCAIGSLETKVFRKITECDFEQYDLVIDALFGAGLSKEVDPVLRDIFWKIECSKCDVVSIDIPTGVDGNTGQIRGGAIKADYTLTFSALKVGHVLHPGKYLSGTVIVCDIGIPAPAGVARVNDPDLWITKLRFPNQYSNKYSRGYVAVLGGEQMLSGAAKLAAYAALRTFAGIVAIICSNENISCYSLSNMTSVILKRYEEILSDNRVNAFIIGPGGGINSDLMQKTLQIIERGKCVIDADAISVFADNPDLLFAKIHSSSNIVFTPHQGEFKRIFKGIPFDSKIELVQAAAKISGATIVLKGDDTVICDAIGNTVVNYVSAPQLATAGAGDVLSGIIGGLIGSGVDSFYAACAGVWIHSEAGRKYGLGLISEDLPVLAGSVMMELANKQALYRYAGKCKADC